MDLNDVTIVPAGSASGVPYMAYLARGRDANRPPCVALLDGDKQGRDARKKLVRGEADGKAILDSEYIIDVADWADGSSLSVDKGVNVIEIEDLIPLPIAAVAARSYAHRILALPEKDCEGLTDASIKTALDKTKGQVWAAVEAAFDKEFDGSHIEKVGFAKEVVEFIERVKLDDRRPNGLAALEKNFQALITSLTSALWTAREAEEFRVRNRRVKSIVKTFKDDYPSGVNRDKAEVVLREIEVSLESTASDDAVRIAVAGMRRTYRLETDPLEQVEDFTQFLEDLDGLPYVGRSRSQEPAVA